MGLIRSAFRLLAYPIMRPLETARGAAKDVKADIALLRDARLKRAREHGEQLERFAAENEEVSLEELQDPTRIKNPTKRFAVLVEANGWTEKGLHEQLVACVLAKRFAKWATVVMLVVGFASLALAPLWSLLFLAPCFMTGSAVGIASMLKYGLYQHQLEHRRLDGLKDYFARADLIRHLLS
jgi:hypothetical protein